MASQTLAWSSTLSVIAAAGRMGGDVHVLVAGSGCADVARQASQVGGVAKVLLADAPHLAEELAECVAEQVTALAASYSHVLAQDGNIGFDLLQKPYSVEELSRLLHKAARLRRVLDGAAE